MELHQLHCFIAVIEEGGFNRATTRLNITQPALSYQIKQLEEELGASLFHRRPRGITPTEAGRVLFQHVQEVMEAVRRSRRAIEMLTNGFSGEIRIGTINSVGVYFLPPVLTRMMEQFPKVRLTVMYRRATEVIEALLSNQVDIAVVAKPHSDRRLNFETLIEEKVSLVCSQNSPFFGKKSIKPYQLNGLPFIMLTQETPTGMLIRDHLARLGVGVDVVVTTPNVDTVRKMVEVGLGVAFLPDMVTSQDVSCDGEPVDKLARVEVRPILTRNIELVTWKKVQYGNILQTFMEELRRHANEWKACVEIKSKR